MRIQCKWNSTLACVAMISMFVMPPASYAVPGSIELDNGLLSNPTAPIVYECKSYKDGSTGLYDEYGHVDLVSNGTILQTWSYETVIENGKTDLDTVFKKCKAEAARLEGEDEVVGNAIKGGGM